MNPLLLAGLTAGLSVYTTYQQSRVARQNTNRTIAENRRMADLAFERDKDMWRMQQDYNTPEAQMKRFEQAGLNPNLIYGQGTPGNATSHPVFTPPRAEYAYKPELDPLGALTAYTSMAQQSAHTDLTRQQLETEAFRSWMIQTQAVNLMTEGQIKQTELEIIMRTFDARADKSIADAAYAQASAIIRKHEAEWASMGMTGHQMGWLRLTYEMLKVMGIDARQIDKLFAPYTKQLKLQKGGQ